MPDTPQAMPVFVSHSHEDDAFCRQLVTALRGAGANVWYDEHNLDSGLLLDTIERELRARPVFVLILSPAALTSQWVRDESKWAYARLKRDPARIILPVLAAPLADADDIWMFLQDFKRIEAPGVQPFPVDEAVRRTLRALALTPAGEAPAPVAPQPSENADDLIARGKALSARKAYREAIPLFEGATQLAPRNFDAWANLGYLYGEVGRAGDQLAACDHALALDPTSSISWYNKGNALRDLKRPDEALAAYERGFDAKDKLDWNARGIVFSDLKRYDEALAAYDRALALDPTFAFAWNNKGLALRNMKRSAEALAACDHAPTLDPNYVYAWNNKGNVLYDLNRPAEALAAYERALALDQNYLNAWIGKGNALRDLKRSAEALAAFERALALDPTRAIAWFNKGALLHDLKRDQEALESFNRAAALGYDAASSWNAKAIVFRALGRKAEAREAEAREAEAREAEAREAEARAKALGG